MINKNPPPEHLYVGEVPLPGVAGRVMNRSSRLTNSTVVATSVGKRAGGGTGAGLGLELGLGRGWGGAGAGLGLGLGLELGLGLGFTCGQRMLHYLVSQVNMYLNADYFRCQPKNPWVIPTDASLSRSTPILP